MFNIYFSDLNKDAQERLMELVDIEDPKEMNWDVDIFPLAVVVTDPDNEEAYV